MSRSRTRIALLLVAATVSGLAAAGCGEDGPVTPRPADPQHISVQYLLVGFAGSIPGRTIARSKAGAESLAVSLYDRARSGEDFDDLVRTWSDSPQQDTVGLANYGVTPAAGEYTRASLVRNFGDVAFALEPDSVGLAGHDSLASPYGWYVILRID